MLVSNWFSMDWMPFNSKFSNNVTVLKKCMLIMALGILIIILYQTTTALQMKCNKLKHEVEVLENHLKLIHEKIDLLQRKHSRLILYVEQSPGFFNASEASLEESSNVQGPGKEYERLRRQIYFGTQELGNFLHHQLKEVLQGRMTTDIRKEIMDEVGERKRVSVVYRWLLWQQERFPTLDGHDKWRHLEWTALSNLIQTKLTERQNPTNCLKAQKLFCTHDVCGLGCSLHHLVYCLAIAFSYKRTFIIQMNSKRYWGEIFLPLSDTCTNIQMHAIKVHSINVLFKDKSKNDVEAVYLSLLRRTRGLPVLPYYIPKELSRRISILSGDPYAWWAGQFVKYVLKLKRPEILEQAIKKINFSTPIVGVHIRRTDKIEEAMYYELDEYMSHVEDYYSKLELSGAVEQRRVYLATDDVHVLQQAIAKYPQYVFYGDYSRAQAAGLGNHETRITSSALTGILLDLHILSMCDHVVCTFSSNVGRMAYELMQTRRMDAVNRFTSLDHMYYFTVDEQHYRVAVMRHQHTDLEVGDVIRFSCGANPKLVKGYSLRTNTIDYIPWHKTEEQLIQYSNPAFRDYNNLSLNRI